MESLSEFHCLGGESKGRRYLLLVFHVKGLKMIKYIKRLTYIDSKHLAHRVPC